jgi:uncharacterized protein (TIGR02145 family)
MTTAGISAPAVLAPNHWGFAVSTNIAATNLTSQPIASFTDDYSTADGTEAYANLPISDTILYETDQLPTQTDDFNFYYAVNVNSSQIAGSYVNYVTYTAVGNRVLCEWDQDLDFDDPACVEPNGEPEPPDEIKNKPTSYIVPNFASTKAPTGNGTGTNGPQFSIYGTGFGSSPTVTIDGKPCTDVVVNSAGTAMTCTGPISGMTDGEKQVSINGSAPDEKYTVWYSSYNFPTLQSLASATCDTTKAIYRDTRDSQLYYVGKLLDNKCWMLDNLRYKPNGDTTGTATSGFSATQVASAGTYLTQNGGSSTASPNQDSPKYIEPIVNTYCFGKTNMPAANISKCGLLYNFYTAAAGTATQAMTSGDASGSICPANWRLPTGGVSGDFSALDSLYGGNGAVQSGSSTASLAALWLPVGAFAGVFSSFYESAFINQGSYSQYWSSSLYTDALRGFGARFYSTSVNPGRLANFRYYGNAVRCVIDE